MFGRRPSQAPADDPLRAHLSGKRRHERVPSAHPVEVRGPKETYGAILSDLSEGGARLEMTDPAFYAAPGLDGLTRVAAAFPDGVRLHLSGTGLDLEAAIVRMLPGEGGRISLGLRFAEPLSPAAQVVLGLPWARARVDGAADVRLATGRSTTHLLVFAGRDAGLVGPRVLAEVLALGSGLVYARAATSRGTPLEVAEDLAGEPRHATLVRARQVVWEGDVRLAHCAHGGDGALELRFLPETPLPAVARRRFRPAIAAAL